MRTAFIKQLITEAGHNEKIVLLVGDLGYNVVDEFANLFPDRFINVGIAEQNMIGIACGLAKEGFIPFVYSIANFPTMRCMEQIRNDACYMDLKVNIVSVGGGFSYGSLGASHQATEELGMMRILPNMNVCAPGDPEETKQIVKMAIDFPHPFYIRLGKAGEPVVHTKSLNQLRLGDIIPILDGKKTAVITTGAMLKYAYGFILDNHIGAALFSMPFVKPINKAQIKALAEKFDKIITLEEHQLSAGMGSAVLEIVNDLRTEGMISAMPLIKRIAIADTFYSVAGSQNYLRNLANIQLSQNLF